MHPIPCFRAPLTRGSGYRVKTILRTFPPSKYITVPNFTQIGQTVQISIRYEQIYIYILCFIYQIICLHLNMFCFKAHIKNEKLKATVVQIFHQSIFNFSIFKENVEIEENKKHSGSFLHLSIFVLMLMLKLRNLSHSGSNF